MQRHVNLVDLENPEKCAYSRYRSCPYSRERASQNLRVLSFILQSTPHLLHESRRVRGLGVELLEDREGLGHGGLRHLRLLDGHRVLRLGPPETAAKDPPPHTHTHTHTLRRNFGRLVLGRIDADVCVQILILQHF